MGIHVPEDSEHEEEQR